MIPYIILAIILTIVVAAFLLSQDGGLSGASGAIITFFALAGLVLVWGGGIAEFIGLVCIVLKILAVDPVNGWTWMQALAPLTLGVLGQVVGIILVQALE